MDGSVRFWGNERSVWVGWEAHSGMDGNDRHICESPEMDDLDKIADDKKTVVVKVGMIGDPQTGKTSLMIKYVENRFDEAYLNTVGKECSKR